MTFQTGHTLKNPDTISDENVYRTAKITRWCKCIVTKDCHRQHQHGTEKDCLRSMQSTLQSIAKEILLEKHC